MNTCDLLEDGYSSINEPIKHVLSGLRRDELKWQPRSDANSIGWLAWHLTRQQDTQIAAFMRRK